MSEQQRPAEPGSSGGSAERFAEILAWHGMARYVEPEALARYVGAPPDGTDDPPGAADVRA